MHMEQISSEPSKKVGTYSSCLGVVGLVGVSGCVGVSALGVGRLELRSMSGSLIGSVPNNKEASCW